MISSVGIVSFPKSLNNTYTLSVISLDVIWLKHAVRRQSGGFFGVFHVLCGMTHFFLTAVAVSLALRNEVD